MQGALFFCERPRVWVADPKPETLKGGMGTLSFRVSRNFGCLFPLKTLSTKPRTTKFLNVKHKSPKERISASGSAKWWMSPNACGRLDYSGSIFRIRVYRCSLYRA